MTKNKPREAASLASTLHESVRYTQLVASSPGTTRTQSLQTLTPSTSRTQSFASEHGDNEVPPYPSRLPSYRTAVRESAIETAQRPQNNISPEQYAEDLRRLQQKLKSSKKIRPQPKDEILLRRLKQTTDLDEMHFLIAERIADMLHMFPESHVKDDDLVTEKLELYTMDSMTGLRLAQWARERLGVKLSLEDFVLAEVTTLDDAARLIASKAHHG